MTRVPGVEHDGHDLFRSGDLGRQTITYEVAEAAARAPN